MIQIHLGKLVDAHTTQFTLERYRKPIMEREIRYSECAASVLDGGSLGQATAQSGRNNQESRIGEVRVSSTTVHSKAEITSKMSQTKHDASVSRWAKRGTVEAEDGGAGDRPD
jgi:hypothetical protein